MSIAEVIIERGWHQGGLVDVNHGGFHHGAVCLYGACVVAAGLNFYDTAALVFTDRCEEGRAVRSIIGADIGAWNDVPGRTYDEVLRVAKEADELLDQWRSEA